MNQSAHESDINCVACNSQGNSFATASSDKTVKLWEYKTGTETSTLFGANQGIMCVDFSPSGEFTLGGCNDGAIRIWAIAQGRVRVSVGFFPYSS